MSNYGAFLKERKNKDMEFFYGEYRMTSNQYFVFNHNIDDDNIIIITSDVKFFKGKPVLVVDNNKVVYLKDWQVRAVKNWNDGFEGFAVKLNRNFFKPYTLSFSFDDLSFEKEETFETLSQIAKTQNDTPIAQGHFKF